MSSKILYKESWKKSDNIIGFCKESPIDVLRRVYKTHSIHSYRGIYRPVDVNSPNNLSGLVIEDIPIKISVTRSIDGLDLDVAEVGLDSPRTENTYRNALKGAISWHLDEFKNGNVENYLYTRERRRDREKEKHIHPLLEIAEVTLDIEKPMIEDLKAIYSEN